jgi:hypothetical protein
MDRTFVDDLKWALFVFIGVVLGYLLFADGETSLLVGSFLGIVLVLVVLNVVRFFRRRR